MLGMFSVFLYAYSLGAGTYTGIEAVSNSMPVMREPRVATAKRTMVYMALSLAFTAGGLIVAYLLLDIQAERRQDDEPGAHRTFVSDIGLDAWGCRADLPVVTLLSEGALLFVAAQAGFIDGRGCWPTWPTTPGCPTGSPTFGTAGHAQRHPADGPGRPGRAGLHGRRRSVRW